ncbi:MAG: hypothetical protein IJR14_07520 [Synergistaceae bacterium]|nr:hypothetical protein [Synergistaceae bacterium]
MSAVITEREQLSRMIQDIPDAFVEDVIRHVSLYLPDPDEPPLTEEELAGLAEAERDVAAGRMRPISEVLRDLS